MWARLCARVTAGRRAIQDRRGQIRHLERVLVDRRHVDGLRRPSRQRTRDGGGPSGVLRNGAARTSVGVGADDLQALAIGCREPAVELRDAGRPGSASCPAKVRSMPRSSYVAKPDAWTTVRPEQLVREAHRIAADVPDRAAADRGSAAGRRHGRGRTRTSRGPAAARRGPPPCASSSARRICGWCRYMNASTAIRSVSARDRARSRRRPRPERQRLLAQDVLARLERADRPRHVQVIRQRDVDDVDIRIRHERVVRVIDPFRAVVVANACARAGSRDATARSDPRSSASIPRSGTWRDAPRPRLPTAAPSPPARLLDPRSRPPRQARAPGLTPWFGLVNASTNLFDERNTNPVMRRDDIGLRSETVRRANLSAIVREPHVHGPQSRSEFVARTGLTRSAIRGLIGELVAADLADEERAVPLGVPGVPPPSSTRPPTRRVVLALEVAVDSLRSSDRRARRHGARPRDGSIGPLITPASNRSSAICSVLTERHRHPTPAVRRRRGHRRGRVGIVRREDGFVRLAPTSAGATSHWAPACAMPSGPHPRHVANDADLGALAEWRRGAAVGVDNVLFLAGEVGVGGGSTSWIARSSAWRAMAARSAISRSTRTDSTALRLRRLLGDRHRRGAAADARGLSGRRRALRGRRGPARSRRRQPACARPGACRHVAGLRPRRPRQLLDPGLIVLGGRFERLYPYVIDRVEAQLDRLALPASRALVRLCRRPWARRRPARRGRAGLRTPARRPGRVAGPA